MELNEAFCKIERLNECCVAVKMSKTTFDNFVSQLKEPENCLDICDNPTCREKGIMGRLWTAEAVRDDSLESGVFVCIGD